MNGLRIAIIGAGNIGTAIANGLVTSGLFPPADIPLTRRKIELLEEFRERGFTITDDNCEAVRHSAAIIVAVEPQQIDRVRHEIAAELRPDAHTVISVVTGVDTAQIARQIDKGVPIVRAMPNTAIAVRESMTCIASDRADDVALELTKSLFDAVGRTLVIDENRMIAATALGACGVAFFLRAIRAASQGGIEIGFHSEEALTIAAQSAKGASTLMQSMENHPESEIDRVTTPRGCTIAGLNQMEHEGFSSAMIKGITVSAKKASKLYTSG